MYNFDVHVKKISRHTTNTCAFYQIEYLSYCIFSINTEINMYKDPSSLLNRKKKMKTIIIDFTYQTQQLNHQKQITLYINSTYAIMHVSNIKQEPGIT